MRESLRYLGVGATALAMLAVAACGGSGESSSTDGISASSEAASAVVVPDGTTFCSAWTDLDDEQSKFLTFGEDGWEDWISGLVVQAKIVEAVAPAELADAAAANAAYFQAQADVQSVAEYVDGNNQLFSYGFANC